MTLINMKRPQDIFVNPFLMLKNWLDTTTPLERGVYTQKLNQDLGKALSVAREIENAKGLIESYHVKANRQNFEVIKDEKPNNKQ